MAADAACLSGGQRLGQGASSEVRPPAGDQIWLAGHEKLLGEGAMPATISVTLDEVRQGFYAIGRD